MPLVAPITNRENTFAEADKYTPITLDLRTTRNELEPLALDNPSTRKGKSKEVMIQCVLLPL